MDRALAAVVTVDATPRMARPRVALVAMLLSGFAALGYQVVWTQQFALWLGHEAASVLAVVSAFFGGLALGARLLGPAIERSRRPLRWYALCEGVIALWALGLAFGLESLGTGLASLIGPQPGALWHWSVAFIGSLLLLLPASVAMGATLPAMERALVRGDGVASAVAPLYAANTLGAMAGVIATAYWLVPAVGLVATSVLCAALNLLCAGIARYGMGEVAALPPPHAPVRRSGLQAVFFLTGLLGIGYEVLAVRALSQVAENTVFTFANLLAVYLAGTAAGAALYSAWQRRAEPSTAPDILPALLRAVALSGLIGVGVMAFGAPLRDALLVWAGPGMAAALWIEAALATAVFLLPTLAMGALFSHLAAHCRDHGLDLGRALSANLLGAALAPALFGVWLVPVAGLRASLLAVVCAYLLLVPRAGWRRPVQWGSVALGALAMVALPSPMLVEAPADGTVVSVEEGVLATVSVVADARGVMTLHINNRQQEGSSHTRRVDGRQAMLPRLMHPGARDALFLGLGTGVTAAVAADDPTLRVTAVELLPEVITAAQHFRAPTGTMAGGARLTTLAADARRFVLATDARYDLIVADNFHPARSGSGLLYTVEHFRAVRARLAPGGLFCQWLPLHQLDLATLQTIVRSYQTVYPDAIAVLASNSLETPVVGLIGWGDGAHADPDAIRAGLERRPDAAGFGFEDVLSVMGNVIAGPASLARFAAGAPVNTDDRPVVIYDAPRVTYAPDDLPRDRLLALVRQLGATPAEVVPESEPQWQARLAAYWRARDRFIVAGHAVRPSANVQDMLAQVRAPLLDILRESPDFRPAYDPLLQMAAALVPRDRDAAVDVLRALAQVQPQRSEAVEGLRALGGR